MKAKISTLPCSPSTPLGTKIEKGFKVDVSYGDSFKTFYGTVFVNNSDGFFSLALVDGTTKHLNYRYVISTEEVTIVTVVTDTTLHSNYHNKTCKESILTQKFSVGLNREVEFVHDYDKTDKFATKIFKHTEVTPVP